MSLLPSNIVSAEAQAEPTVVSTFSGIGGLDKGLLDAGFKIRSHAEILPFRRKVLERRFPGVPCYDDVKAVTNADGATVLCGGFPCQDLSVAGRRAGLKGERSSLFWEIVRIVSGSAVRPRFILLENVPGLLSSCSCRGCRKCSVLLRWHRRRGCKGSPGCTQCAAAERIRKRHAGTDAALVFAALGNLGYRVSYRILDSRHFGVPQRRRRVFILAERDSGGEGAPEVLSEPEGGEGDPLAVGEPWPGAARAAAGGAERRGVEGFAANGGDDLASTLGAFGSTGGHRQDLDSAGAYVVEPEEVANTLKGQRGKDGGGLSQEETLVPGRQYAPDEAATLTRGSSSDGVSEPGRRQEDDLNLVAEEHYYVDGTEDGTLRANGGTDASGKPGNRADKQPMVIAAETGPGHWVEGDEAATLAQRDWRSPSTVVGDQEEVEGEALSFLAGTGEKARSMGIGEDVAPTLGSEANGNQRTPTVVYSKGHAAHDAHEDAENWNEAEVARTLHSMGHAGDLVVAEEGLESGVPTSARVYDADGEAPTLQASDSPNRDGTEGPKVFVRNELGGGREPDPAATSEAAGDAAPGAGAVPEADEEPLALAWQQGDDSKATGTGRGRSWVARAEPGYSGALSKQRHDAIQYRDVVRRLTPTECERLQGLPDGWTKLDDSTPDGPRYAALGDAVTTAPAWWIGRRILAKIAWLESRAE